jgi:hypothetical protein
MKDQTIFPKQQKLNKMSTHLINDKYKEEWRKNTAHDLYRGDKPGAALDTKLK